MAEIRLKENESLESALRRKRWADSFMLSVFLLGVYYL